MMVQAIRVVNTMGGLQAFAMVITCGFEEIMDVQQSLSQCGVANYELGLIHSSDEMKGRWIQCKLIGGFSELYLDTKHLAKLRDKGLRPYYII